MYSACNELMKLATLVPKVCVCVGGGGGGYSDIFIQTEAQVIFWGSQFWISIFFLIFFLGGGGGAEGFRKMINFGNTKILWIFFLCHHKIGLYLGEISMHFMVFS